MLRSLTSTRLAAAFTLSLAVLASQARAEPVTVVPAKPPSDAKLQRHEKMNERVKQGNVDLLFIGDSITQGWEKNGKEVWDKHYAPRNAVNLGTGGDRTEHVLWRLQNGNLDGISPRLAVIMIGTNNSGSNTPEEIAAGIEAIVKLLRDKLPKMKILLLAVFPRGDAAEDPRHKVNQKTNEIIAKLADGKTVEYLDIGAKFLKDGKLTKDIMPDLLHLSPEGYEIWAKAIEPSVVKVMGSGQAAGRARRQPLKALREKVR